jgi:hypothetical protein
VPSYDIDGLDDEVIEAARCTHPLITHEGESHASRRHGAAPRGQDAFSGALSAPAAPGSVFRALTLG